MFASMIGLLEINSSWLIFHLDAWILDEETRIKRRRIDQANVDEWNSVMEEFPGFPACTLSGLSDKDRELDFKELGVKCDWH